MQIFLTLKIINAPNYQLIKHQKQSINKCLPSTKQKPRATARRYIRNLGNARYTEILIQSEVLIQLWRHFQILFGYLILPGEVEPLSPVLFVAVFTAVIIRVFSAGCAQLLG
jgi:hypothetical protein